MSSRFKIVLSSFLILGSLYFFFVGIIHGKAFLIPLTTAIILSMLMNPVARKFMKWGVGRGWAILFSDLIVVAAIGFMIFLLVAQANNVAKNWSQIESNLKPVIEKVQNFYNQKIANSINQLNGGDSSQSQNNQTQSSSGNQGGQSQQQNNQSSSQQQGQQSQSQNQQPKQGQQSQQQQQSDKQGQEGLIGLSQQQGQQQSGQSFGIGSVQDVLTGIVKNVFSFLSNLLLILVYIFFFMYYHKKFEDAIVKMVPENKREHTRSVIKQSSEMAQKYLFGRFILIAILAVLYMIGFTLSGLKHAIFVSLLAALFSLLPYIGNVIAVVLALGLSFMSGGETGQIIGIIISFSIIQFVESYILEPYVVGDKVDLNPVIIIVGVVLGGLVWGVMGMILVIPIMGIMKVIFDNVDDLRPLGYALDERGISSNGGGWPKKVKDWAMKKLKK